MKILFDIMNAQPAEGSRFHGGGEYIKTVFKKLIENLKNVELVVFYDFDRFLDDWVKIIIQNHLIRRIDIKCEQDITFIDEPFDVFFSGLPYRYKREWLPNIKLFIGTIHGLRGLEKPYDEFDYMYNHGSYYISKIKKTIKNIKYVVLDYEQKIKEEQLNTFKNCINALDVIVCDSQHTKYSILNFFDISEDKFIVKAPPKKISSAMGKEERNMCPKEKFLLLIGGNRWIKNCYRAIVAIDQLIAEKKLKDYKMVIVGALSDLIRGKIHNIDRFVLLDYVSPGQLEELYKNCEAFIYPSLNEGFGYPPLEAMAYGTTCVVSAVCSLPEVCGDAVYYFNPYDINEIRTRILNAVNDKIPEDKVLSHYHQMLIRQNADIADLIDIIKGQRKI